MQTGHSILLSLGRLGWPQVNKMGINLKALTHAAHASPVNVDGRQTVDNVCAIYSANETSTEPLK